MGNGSGYGATIKALGEGKFVTLESRLDGGGSLQARKLAGGAVQLYWRYSHEGRKNREPIGLYDPSAPPKKLEPSAKGYGIAAALAKCRLLAEVHRQHVRRGGLKQVKADERQRFEAEKAAKVEKADKTLKRLLETYIAHLEAQGRTSWADAERLFETHVIEAWPDAVLSPAADITPDQVLDMLRRLIEQGKGRSANKLRSYLRAAYQCAIDVRTMASIPLAFKAFGVVFNPAAQTKRDPKFDRADKRPLSTNELQTYWRNIERRHGIEGASLRLHLLTGGQRIEQFVRLRRRDVTEHAITIYDAKGRPGQGPRLHSLPLLPEAEVALDQLPKAGEYVVSTTQGRRPISSTTLAGWARDAVGDSIPGFQLKRIRSGIETLLAANGVSREIRGHIQSHGLTGVQSRHYDGHDYMPEKLAALQVLRAQLERTDDEKVVPTGRNRVRR